VLILRATDFLGGYTQGKAAAYTPGAGDLYFSIMILNDMLDDGKS